MVNKSATRFNCFGPLLLLPGLFTRAELLAYIVRHVLMLPFRFRRLFSCKLWGCWMLSGVCVCVCEME